MYVNIAMRFVHQGNVHKWPWGYSFPSSPTQIGCVLYLEHMNGNCVVVKIMKMYQIMQTMMNCHGLEYQEQVHLDEGVVVLFSWQVCVDSGHASSYCIYGLS